MNLLKSKLRCNAIGGRMFTTIDDYVKSVRSIFENQAPIYCRENVCYIYSES
jgi:hypothetical protein